MSSSTANNCIVWDNTSLSGMNHNLGNLNNRYTCSPDVTHGADGCITNKPMLVSSSHIAINSPCRNAGNISYSSGTDIDGDSWATPPSMGCDEPSSESPYGSLNLFLQGVPQAVVSGFEIEATAMVIGQAAYFTVDFGDGTIYTNTVTCVHAWNEPGIWPLTLTAFNNDFPNGTSTTKMIAVGTKTETTIHVAANGNDENSGHSWAEAKQTLQNGIDAQTYLAGRILITNGTYNLSSEICITNTLDIQSVNGATTTIVNGKGSRRCFNIGFIPCTISGLTISNGYHSTSGGGALCQNTVPVFDNCIFIENRATDGGALYRGTASNCTFSQNTAKDDGGAIYQGIANVCMFNENSAEDGGAMYGGTANNCSFLKNTATDDGGGMLSGTANHCTFRENKAYGGAGMHSGQANNCTFTANEASRYGGGKCDGVSFDCSFIENTAYLGAGMMYGEANNCDFSSNKATTAGGGIYEGTATNCTFTGNSALDSGGGAYESNAVNCSFFLNEADDGGGMFASSAVNCIFIANQATDSGGGQSFGSAAGCIFTANKAGEEGGGMAYGYPYNCTFTANKAYLAGGLHGCTGSNCISWDNVATVSEDDVSTPTLRYSCASDVTHGMDGCITNNPMLN